MSKTNNDYIISLSGLTKNYGHVQALRGIDLQIPRGEFFGLVGPDGAGKTTLIKILAGIISYGDGKAKVMGKDLRSDLNDIRLEIGYVSQTFNLYKDMTVGENIDFFYELYAKDGTNKAFKDEMLEFIGLKPFVDRLAGNLSGGMKQKLALLAALIHEPKMLFLDEPTTGVDPVSRRDFWQIVFKLQKRDLTVVASTPYMDEAEQFDRIALMNDGQFLRIGTSDEIRNSVPGEVLEILCETPPKARKALKGTPEVDDVELFGDKIHVFVKKADEATKNRVISILKNAGIGISEMGQVPYSIEDVFMRVEPEETPETIMERRI